MCFITNMLLHMRLHCVHKCPTNVLCCSFTYTRLSQGEVVRGCMWSTAIDGMERKRGGLWGCCPSHLNASMSVAVSPLTLKHYECPTNVLCCSFTYTRLSQGEVVRGCMWSTAIDGMERKRGGLWGCCPSHLNASMSVAVSPLTLKHYEIWAPQCNFGKLNFYVSFIVGHRGQR